ncbi:LOW QUALITY PROTEIN: ezrin-like [Melanotaenia boesemani]|uniref:LOW QUALITY PROTEIN: ezrin-like n=1 Tax=Melanotaenia boesemani TaxID=1250792 RepID=UPI001C045446|nr:LOW QUALITY PROTEIN: ezrin-like [Melanotaenia boesemani]
MPKEINIHISLMDSEQEFPIKPNTKGSQLLAQVASSIGLREVSFFGLQFVNAKGSIKWLKLEKKVLSQNVKKETPLRFKLRVRFYPKDTMKELILNSTRKLFFLQVEEDIRSKAICCPPETADLLASYANQAKCGEEGAMMEYLRIAQDLEMYGISYFEIKNTEGTELWLGVSMQGLNIYTKENKLTPTSKFPWSDIKKLSYVSKKFIIRLTEKTAPNIIYYSPEEHANKDIIQLCMGYHSLHLLPKMADSVEVQQLKAQ